MPDSIALRTAIETLRQEQAATGRKPREQDYRGVRLLADGRKAIQMLNEGLSLPDVRMVIPGSRARLYRALKMARINKPGIVLVEGDDIPACDPLLL